MVIVLQRVGKDVIIYYNDEEYRVSIELLISLIQLVKQ